MCRVQCLCSVCGVLSSGRRVSACVVHATACIVSCPQLSACCLPPNPGSPALKTLVFRLHKPAGDPAGPRQGPGRCLHGLCWQPQRGEAGGCLLHNTAVSYNFCSDGIHPCPAVLSVCRNTAAFFLAAPRHARIPSCETLNPSFFVCCITPPHQVFNISGERYVTFDGIARACAKAAGAPEPELVHFNAKDFDFGKKKVCTHV